VVVCALPANLFVGTFDIVTLMNLGNSTKDITVEIDKWEQGQMVNDFSSISLHTVKGIASITILKFACLTLV
jgi:hypothetical protein